MFKNIIVRKPGKLISEGITSAPELGKPNYENAIRQHQKYVEALKSCGVNVTELEPLEEYPDSCFMEDVAVVTRKCAIITNPGAKSRKGEEKSVIDVLKKFYDEDNIEYIKVPGTLEGGDVMMVGDHFYVGLSARTNEEGIRQFISILEKYGLSGSAVPLKGVLHLKTGLAYLENNNLLVAGEFIDNPIFEKFNKIVFGLMIMYLYLKAIQRQKLQLKKLVMRLKQ
jgi:dimethylargininase